MRIVLQRVRYARVEVDGATAGEIHKGLLILLGVKHEDTRLEADYMLEKTLGLRIFPDDEGKMNRSVLDIEGELLVVSQFTLYGDCRKGRRPSFDQAAGPQLARELYDYFCDAALGRGIRVQRGVFQAMMQVHLINDGPVTLIYDSPQSR
jgi:D-aminoacyl-tRNA deacylase